MKKWAKKQIPMDLKKLQKKADKLFQLGRRVQESDADGNCYCITCGIKKHYKKLDAGHFIQRGYLATRYESNNTWPQCKACNMWKSGDYSRYRDNLAKKIGKEQLEYLEIAKYGTVVAKRKVLEGVIAKWSEFLNSRGIKA